MKKIFFDTETSGLDCRSCKIIELAMITVDDGEIKERYDKFVRIYEPLDPKITELTGIDDNKLYKDGVDEEEIANDLKEKMTKGTWMIAHNAQFDIGFIYSLLQRHFPDEADEIVRNIRWIDTLTILKDRKDYPHKLFHAVKHYGIEEVNFHRAIDDTIALYHVALAMKMERDDLKCYENLFGYNPKWHKKEMEFEFIEYKAQPFHNRGMLPPDKILPNV